MVRFTSLQVEDSDALLAERVGEFGEHWQRLHYIRQPVHRLEQEGCKGAAESNIVLVTILLKM